MKSLVLLLVILAVAGIACWMVVDAVSTYRQIREADYPAAETQKTLADSKAGGVLVAAPLLGLMAVGAPQWVVFMYLVLMVVVLGFVVVRRRSVR